MKQTKNIFILLLPVLTIIGCASSKKPMQTQQSQQYIAQAQASLDNESSAQALALLAQAIKLDNSNPNLYIMQAQAYKQQNNLSLAISSYDSAIKLSPKNGLYLSAKNTTLCTLNDSSNLNDLNKTYDKALKLEQNNPQNIAQINADQGNCLLSRHSFDDATALFESAIMSSNPPIDAYTGITKVYIEQGNYPKAALMINSIPNNEQNRQIILLKIDALSGLLDKKYNISDKNRKILINKISQLNLQLTQNQPSKAINPVVIRDKTSESASPTVTKVANKPTAMAKAPQSLPPEPIQKITPTAKQPVSATNTTFAKRIKTASNGKKYLVIQPGDTLFSVSKQSGVSQDHIIKLNHLKNQFVPLNTKVYLN